MNNFDFSASTVLVTGASRGLGQGLVEQLAKRGTAQIYAGCRTEEGVAHVRSLQLPNVTPILLDVTRPDTFASLPGSIGRLDLLINNAGIASACGFTASDTLATAENEMRVHYFGVVALTQAMLPLLRQSSRAGVINIASIAAFSNVKAMGTYSASKAALHFLTQGLRAELAGDGIFVQGVYPGPFDTRLAAGYNGPKKSPGQIADIVLDLFSEQVEEAFPDDFSSTMHKMFLESPRQLAAAFAQDM